MVGVDTQVFHGFVRCGAGGAITGVGNALPKEVLRRVEMCEQAAAETQPRVDWLPNSTMHSPVLATFDEGPDLVLYYKHLMSWKVVPNTSISSTPTDQLAPSQKAFLEAQWKLFRDWWDSWDGKDWRPDA